MNVEALREAHGEVRERVDAAAAVSGRGPGEVEIVVTPQAGDGSADFALRLRIPDSTRR